MFTMKKFFAGAVFGILTIVALFSVLTVRGDKVITVSNEGVTTGRKSGEALEAETV